MRDRRLQIEGAECAVRRKLLIGIQNHIRLGDPPSPVIKNSRRRRGLFRVLCEQHDIFRRRRDSDQADTVAGYALRADALPVGIRFPEFDPRRFFPSSKASSDRPDQVASGLDIGRGARSMSLKRRSGWFACAIV